MPLAEDQTRRRRVRRSQLTDGLHWLYAAQGDPYARLVCGAIDDAALREALRTSGPLTRSRTGAWVVTGQTVAARALADARFGADLPPGLTPGQDAPSPETVAAACPPPPGERFDLVELARSAALTALAGDDERVRAAARDGEPLLDALVCPASPEAAARAEAAVEILRDATAWPLLAATGVRMATALCTNAATALFGAGRWPDLVAGREAAARVVDETLRWAPPMRILPLTPSRPAQLDGQAMTPEDRVVLLLDVANRSPEVFAAPDDFHPNRTLARAVLIPGGPYAPVIAFARALAGTLLGRLAAEAPTLRPDGPAVRRGRAPVTAALSRMPVRIA